MKRIASILLAVILSVTLLPTSIFATSVGMDNFRQMQTYAYGQFKDVEQNAWYANSVKQAYELGLVKGSSSTSFSPVGTITIAEAITLACRLHSIYMTGTADFKQSGTWYQVYVDYALANHIIDAPYGDYSILATRSDFAKILSRALPKDALDEINTVDDNAIPDVLSTSANADAIYLLYRAGILTGSDSYGSFNPSSSITRSEVAAIVTRMADRGLRKSIFLTRTFYDGEDGKIALNRVEDRGDGKAILYLDFTNPKPYPVYILPVAIDVNGYNFQIYNTLWPTNSIVEAGSKSEVSYILDANYDICGFKVLKQFGFFGSIEKADADGNIISTNPDDGEVIVGGSVLTMNGEQIQSCPAPNAGTIIYSDDYLDIIYLSEQSLLNRDVALFCFRNKSNDNLTLKNNDMTINGQNYSDMANYFFAESNLMREMAVILPQSQGNVYYASVNGVWSEIQSIGSTFDVSFYNSVTGNMSRAYTIAIPSVYVGKKVDATAVSLDKTEQTLYTGQTLQLNAIVWPENAIDRSVTFSSSNPAIATVDSNGVVTAIKKGTTTITASSVNGKKTTCIITVAKAPTISPPTSIAYTDIGETDFSLLYPDGNSLKISKNSVSGVTVSWIATNQSGKTINYYTCYITMYNPVGDKAYDEITGKSTIKVRTVGPVANGHSLMLYDLIGYSGFCSRVVIDKVYLEYADGTSEMVSYGYSS